MLIDRMEATMKTTAQSNRRRFMATTIALGSGLALNHARVAAQDDVPATSSAELEDGGEASMPDWGFVVRSYIDPFQGKLQFPEGIPSDRRVVQVEVVIVNASDQPLSFKASDVHLMDNDGIEYAAGNAAGFEPKLVSQDLPDGERTRGSVWFVVPESAQMAEVKFFAPPPQLRVKIGTDG
jgi:hypothetical protein